MGKTVTFTGTGAGNMASVTTNPDGTFTATGTAPTTVATGWTVQAHFAADSLYGIADSMYKVTIRFVQHRYHQTQLLLQQLMAMGLQ